MLKIITQLHIHYQQSVAKKRKLSKVLCAIWLPSESNYIKLKILCRLLMLKKLIKKCIPYAIMHLILYS